MAVADNGIGIPLDQQKDIFKKLFRADNARIAEPDGSGLGLYIVKEIVNNAGGKIWFISNKKKGTIFSVSIPLSGMVKKGGNKYLL
jgi:signal transduction histidine kinase